MKKKMIMNRKTIYRILFAGTFAIVLAGILLPGLFLIQYREAELDQVSAAPAEYYSAAGSAMSRNASAKLGVYQKLQLITGQWESQLSEAASYEMNLEDYEAVAAAREGMKELYDNGLYPSNISTEYGNWYAWEAKPYKAVDVIFQTYTAYYWKICFSRYDGSEKHTVCLLEDGTIFLVEAEYSEDYETDPSGNVADYLQSLEVKDMVVTEQDTQGANLADWAVYPDMDMTNLQWKSLVEMTREEETCYILQAYSGDRYLGAMVPQ